MGQHCKNCRENFTTRESGLCMPCEHSIRVTNLEIRLAAMCEYCHDTGWYGDNGPGTRGNRECMPCDMCKAKGLPTADESLLTHLRSEVARLKQVEEQADRQHEELNEMTDNLHDAMDENARLKNESSEKDAEIERLKTEYWKLYERTTGRRDFHQSRVRAWKRCAKMWKHRWEIGPHKMIKDVIYIRKFVGINRSENFISIRKAPPDWRTWPVWVGEGGEE